MYRYGGELLYHFFPENTLVPYIAAGFSGLSITDRKEHGVFDYGVGAKYFLHDRFALRGDVRHLLYGIDGRTTSNVEYTLGAYIPFGGATPAAKPVEPAPAPAPAPKPVEPPAPAPSAPAPPAAPLAPTATLTVNPTTITKGQSAVLNWKSQHATGCEIQPAIGAVPPQGVRSIIPDASTSYSLSCSGAGGTATSAAAITVVVPAPVRAAEKSCVKPAVLKILFDVDKSNIKPLYKADLKKIGGFLKEFPKAKVEINGHTDSTASNAYNQRLSVRRAGSVKKYIATKFGVATGRMTARGYGETQPVASNKSKQGRASNRRVEAIFSCE
jgi:OOP family OmpA-OmpF porin